MGEFLIAIIVDFIIANDNLFVAVKYYKASKAEKAAKNAENNKPAEDPVEQLETENGLVRVSKSFPGEQAYSNVTVEEENSVKESQSELSSEHQQIIELASQISVDDGVKEWTIGDLIEWKASKDDTTLFNFKKQWVKGYGDVIKAAAARYDLPEYLVAGVSYIEVGGDPLWIDDVAYNIRKVIPTGKKADLTSFGNISMQIRTAAETLGYDSSNLTNVQRKAIISSLKDPRQNIFIAAKHLSDLRNIDFKGVGAKQLTTDQVKVIGTRYNRGGGLSLQSIMKNMSYGEFIVNRKSLLEGLLND